MIQFDVITLFPEMFESVLASSIVKRAIGKDKIKVKVHYLRKWATDKYGTVDDRPFGGGVGMLLKIEPIAAALETISSKKVILLSAKGKRLTQKKVEELAKMEQLTIICGHYEGVDARVEKYLVDEEISIGDYVLSGGELPAMVLIDCLTRLQKGVLGKDESSLVESFSKINGKRQKELPQYTRPREFNGWKVPDVLLSGNPKKIKLWQENLESSSKD